MLWSLRFSQLENSNDFINEDALISKFKALILAHFGVAL